MSKPWTSCSPSSKQVMSMEVVNAAPQLRAASDCLGQSCSRWKVGAPDVADGSRGQCGDGFHGK